MPDDQPPARHRGTGRARRPIDWWPWAWSSAAALWAWVTYRAAELELPSAVVATTYVAAAAAYTAGYLVGGRQA